jgi:hypothetical protein
VSQYTVSQAPGPLWGRRLRLPTITVILNLGTQSQKVCPMEKKNWKWLTFWTTHE